MRQIPAVTAVVWIIVPATAAAQDAKTVIDNASQALGATGLNSIVISGEGGVRQLRPEPDDLVRARLDVDQELHAHDRLHAAGVTRDRPGRASRRASSVHLPPARRTPYPFESITPAGESWAEQMEIWVTPWGFLRGAADNAATARSRKIEGVTYSVVTWSPAQKAPSGQPYRVIGYINPQQILERVETWIEHPVFGDMHVETFLQ